MFEPEELERLVPAAARRAAAGRSERPGRRRRSIPIAATEAIAYDFLAKGGKHSRPFITLAVYDALTGGKGTRRQRRRARRRSSATRVRRAAMSIETFHKASLVHDDIEDDDAFRYGEETVHRKYGIADGDQRRRLPDRPGLSPGQPRGEDARAGRRRRHSRLPGRRPPAALRRAGGRAAVARLAATSG